MTHPRAFPTLSVQRGVSLIEVLVGLTAGLILIGALAYFFLGARQANRNHDDVSRMQESGRVALEVLGKAIRQAGARASVAVPFAGAALAATEGTGGAPDTITVRYDVQDGGEADCLGNPVATGAVTYVFAVIGNALTCTNDPGAAETVPPRVVVMDNIENMQIRYGVDSNHDGALEVYQTAKDLTTSEAAAVRVSLLVRGPTPNVATGNQTYTYDATSTTTSDGFLRQVYSAAFTLRNQAR